LIVNKLNSHLKCDHPCFIIAFPSYKASYTRKRIQN